MENKLIEVIFDLEKLILREQNYKVKHLKTQKKLEELKSKLLKL
jgi:hypothetical protein